MYRAISVAHRDRHLSVIFAPQIYNKLLVTTKTFCRKSAKYVVKHILEIFELLYFVGVIVKHCSISIGSILLPSFRFWIDTEHNV